MSSVKRGINLNDFGKDTKKRRTLTEDELEKFAVGSIIKVKVRNFVTYASTEFTLSPSLNMIIGPNGTGKSTFVCAVCLGLGGSPTILGRQKVLSGFIKNGEESGYVEITLKNEKGKPNVVIRRELYQNNKSEWHLNNKLTSESKVQQVLAGFNIQLDNLCQFLPQEKVADFAKLSPDKLLQETQRAVDIKLLQQHNQLIKLDEERALLASALEAKRAEFEKLENDKSRYEEEAKKYEAFKKKKQELEDHEKLIPYAKMQDMKFEADRLKAERDEIKEKLKEFQVAPFGDALSEFEANSEQYLNAIHDLRRKLEDLKEKLDETNQKIQTADDKRRKLLANIERHKTNAAESQDRLERAKAELIRAREERQSLDTLDPQELENIKNEMSKLHDARYALQTEVEAKDDDIKQIVNSKQRTQSRMIQLQESLNSKDRLYILEGNRSNQAIQTKRAVELLRGELNRFRVDVFEPPCLTVSTTRPEYANYLEELLDFQTSMALTARSSEAYDHVVDLLNSKYNCNVSFRYLNNRQLNGDIPQQQLKAMGFDGYLRDFLTGPPEVIQMLSEQSFVHDIPVAVRPLSDAQIEQLRKPVNGHLIFRKFFSGDTMYSLSISRYGSRQITVKTTKVKNNPTLFVSGGMPENRKREIQQQILNLETELASFDERVGPLEDERRHLGGQLDEIEAQYAEYKNAAKEAGRIKKEAEKLDIRIVGFEAKCAKLETEANQDHTAEIDKMKKRIMVVFVEKLADLAELAELQAKYNSIAKEITLLEVKRFEEENKKISVKRLTRAFEEEKRNLEAMYLQAKKRLQDFKNSDLRRNLQQQTASYSEELKEKLTAYITEYTAVNKFNEESIVDMVEGLRSELKLLGTSSKSSVNTLERIIESLANLTIEIDELTSTLQSTELSIKQISEVWSPRLHELVAKISQKFSSIFPTVGVAGEVRIAKAQAYSQWKLEILVSFRDESELKVLDSQTQSGGERAVSTVYYMISMQELTTSPFRVVDEINQGMDARNERIVHKHMVETACQEHTSQYFLITPKLLTNLFYAKNMRVHCIMAGPWTPNPLENPDALSLGATSVY